MLPLDGRVRELRETGSGLHSEVKTKMEQDADSLNLRMSHAGQSLSQEKATNNVNDLTLGGSSTPKKKTFAEDAKKSEREVKNPPE